MFFLTEKNATKSKGEKEKKNTLPRDYDNAWDVDEEIHKPIIKMVVFPQNEFNIVLYI